MDEAQTLLIRNRSQTDDPYGACIVNPDGGGDITRYHEEESVLNVNNAETVDHGYVGIELDQLNHVSCQSIYWLISWKESQLNLVSRLKCVGFLFE